MPIVLNIWIGPTILGGPPPLDIRPVSAEGVPLEITTEDGIVIVTEDDVRITTEGFLGPESAPEVGGLFASEQQIPVRPASLEPWEWIIRVAVWGMMATLMLSCSGV